QHAVPVRPGDRGRSGRVALRVVMFGLGVFGPGHLPGPLEKGKATLFGGGLFRGPGGGGERGGGRGGGRAGCLRGGAGRPPPPPSGAEATARGRLAPAVCNPPGRLSRSFYLAGVTLAGVISIVKVSTVFDPIGPSAGQQAARSPSTEIYLSCPVSEQNDQ